MLHSVDFHSASSATRGEASADVIRSCARVPEAGFEAMVSGMAKNSNSPVAATAAKVKNAAL
jgi:hypothetical protein